MGETKQGGKNKKYGRNKAWCLTYSARQIKTKNKLIRLRRHIKKFPNDVQAVEVLKSI